jgi:cob(I)alamin adenosyltransferase
MAGEAEIRKPATSDVRNELGLIHVYTGNGKGKTTASLGLALRALGHGFRVCVIQFMKGGRFFGELLAAEKYFPRRLFFAQFGQSTPFERDIREGRLKPSKAIFLPFENEKEQMGKALAYAKKAVASGKYDLVILDEVMVAISMGHLDVKDVLELCLSKPKRVELVLTGRSAPKELIAIADYANEVVPLKHPFDKKRKKVIGRRGIEY